jgi:hypothetical protein
MIYSPITLPIIWRCRVRVEYLGTLGIGGAALVHVAVAPCTSRRTTLRLSAAALQFTATELRDKRAALAVSGWTRVILARRSFASVIAQLVDAAPTDAR